MKATRKPITDEVWCNIEGNPMPEWVQKNSEVEAVSGTTFIVRARAGNDLCRIGDYIIKGPTDTYVCSKEGFDATYEAPQA